MTANLLTKNQALFNNNNMKPFLDMEGKSRAITIDGPMTDQYSSATPKILWILREVHGKGEPGSLIKYVNEDLIGRDRPRWSHWYSSWGLIIKVTHAILDNNFIMFAQHPRIVRRCLERIAVINLNKFGGGGRKSKHYSKGVEFCKDLVKSQFELLSPDIVILGGTGQDFVNLGITDFGIKDFSSHKKRFPSIKKDEVTFISAYHPGQTSITHFTYSQNILNVLKK